MQMLWAREGQWAESTTTRAPIKAELPLQALMRVELDRREGRTAQDSEGWRLAMTLDMPGEMHAVWGVWTQRDSREWERTASYEWPYGSIAGTVENMGGDPSIRPYALQQVGVRLCVCACVCLRDASVCERDLACACWSHVSMSMQVHAHASSPETRTRMAAEKPGTAVSATRG